MIKNLLKLFHLYIQFGKLYRKFNASPVIIIGAPRSGTTLLLSILDSHPKIQGIPMETNLLITPRSFRNSYLNRVKKSLEILSVLNGKQIKKSADRWCEKTPKNILHVKEILAEFDNHAKIIHILRDGRDVILSKHPDFPDNYFVTPEEWVCDVSEGLKYRDYENVYLVKYEVLVQKYSETIAKICEFLDLDLAPEIINFKEHTSIRSFNSWSEEVKNVHSKSVGKRKLPENLERISQLEQIPEAINLLREYYPEK